MTTTSSDFTQFLPFTGSSNRKYVVPSMMTNRFGHFPTARTSASRPTCSMKVLTPVRVRSGVVTVNATLRFTPSAVDTHFIRSRASIGSAGRFGIEVADFFGFLARAGGFFPATEDFLATAEGLAVVFERGRTCGSTGSAASAPRETSGSGPDCDDGAEPDGVTDPGGATGDAAAQALTADSTSTPATTPATRFRRPSWFAPQAVSAGIALSPSWHTASLSASALYGKPGRTMRESGRRKVPFLFGRFLAPTMNVTARR